MPPLEEGLTKAFVVSPGDLPDLARLASDAAKHATFAGAVVRSMRLVYHDPINPHPGEDPLRWTVYVSSPRESAEIVFDHTGRYAGADLGGTERARKLDLFAGGKDLDDMLHRIRAAAGGEPVLAFMRITPHRILFRTEDKQYEADVSGIADRTPQAFFCHMTTDIAAGRFNLAAVDGRLMADLIARAREAVPMPRAQVAAVILTAPQAATTGAPAPLQWAIEAGSGGRTVRVLFDGAGTLLGVRGWDERHACD